MASLSKSRLLFGFTSPRTIEKIIPEIKLLCENFEGEPWNQENQIAFYRLLSGSRFFEGGSEQQLKDGMAARDRINRAPKAFGFVEVSPSIRLTKAGERLLSGKRIEETITKQMMKFQLPSPNHTQSNNKDFQYNIRPYLELFRLIYDLGSITKTEIATFFLQMIDYNMYEEIKMQILDFRKQCLENRGKRNRADFVFSVQKKVILKTWNIEELKIREGTDKSIDKKLKTKISNLMDYADAMFRYIRATGLISLDKKSYRIIISPTKKEDVLFLLNSIPRDPLNYTNKAEFLQYLYDPDNIKLLSDDISSLKMKLSKFDIQNPSDDVETLKDALQEAYNKEKSEKEEKASIKLKSYEDYDAIIETFDKIKSKDIIDPPLMMEYNSWRAMTMINHTKEIKGNFITDIDLMPISTAGGNKSDIEILYDDFGLIVEVTTATGSKQYEMEGEPVARHFGRAKENLHENMYCLFIATKLNDDCVGYMFNTNRMNTKAYGGKTKIIPLSVDDFKQFLSTANKHKIQDSTPIKKWLESVWKKGQDPNIDEEVWRNYIKKSITNWSII